jgi:hypothetical protein
VERAFAGPPTGEGGAVCRISPSISRSDSMQVEAGARRRIWLAATTPGNAHIRTSSPSLSSRWCSVHVGIQTFRKPRSSRTSCCCCCGGCIATCRHHPWAGGTVHVFEGSYDRMRCAPWRVCCSSCVETASPVRSEIAPWPPSGCAIATEGGVTLPQVRMMDGKAVVKPLVRYIFSTESVGPRAPLDAYNAQQEPTTCTSRKVASHAQSLAATEP